MRDSLWASADLTRWQHALASYDAVIAAQGVNSLAGHDAWYCTELPQQLAARTSAYVTHDELVRITEWKMARGVWRARNLVLVRGNAPELVAQVTADAFASVPDPTAPIRAVSTLAGVGPATASAVLAAYAPAHYPFLDELVAAQVPSLGAPAFTLGYYRKYADALCSRARALGNGWMPAHVERALWAQAGGKSSIDLDSLT